jgi:hypothetical protein
VAQCSPHSATRAQFGVRLRPGSDAGSASDSPSAASSAEEKQSAYSPKLDFRGADLSGATFYGAYAPNADLSGANLEGAYFWGANLRGVDLRRANLVSATGLRACRFGVTRLPPQGRIFSEFATPGDGH